jgi:hypothetical protein
MNKTIGVLLFVLTILTIIGMVIDNDAFWNIHNYITVVLTAVAGFALYKQK